VSSLKGRARLLKKMAAIPADIRKEMAAAIQQGAEDIVRLQKSLAPEDSGDLRDSIVSSAGGAAPKCSAFKGGQKGGGKSDPDLSVTISAGNAKVRYAHIVEFGSAPHVNGGLFAGSQHPGTPAKPFFFPGYRAMRRKVKGRITRATKKAIRKSVGQ
jgi:HK97 gp10 family phage protein